MSEQITLGSVHHVALRVTQLDRSIAFYQGIFGFQVVAALPDVTILSNGTVNAATRRTLRTLAPDARFEQLCDIEAMEQVAAHQKQFQPQQAVAYATADTRVAGNTLIADGGAFLSKGRWYRLAFRCEVTPDRMKVLSFDFAIGGPLDHGVGLGSADAD